jgi:hypothetical protein
LCLCAQQKLQLLDVTHKQYNKRQRDKMANRTIYALGGVSGSGKTYLRNRHPTLRDLECVDIGDIYQVADEDGAVLEWRKALEAFVVLVNDVLDDTQADFVVEAFLRPDGPQRQRYVPSNVCGDTGTILPVLGVLLVFAIHNTQQLHVLRCNALWQCQQQKPGRCSSTKWQQQQKKEGP